DRNSGVAPDIARSLTVPLTARSPIEPPGKNGGLTTKESVENASRRPSSSTTAESPSSRPAASPYAGRNKCSMSSADMAPPPPWPITTNGVSRRGTGQVHESKSNVVTSHHFESAVRVVGGARTFGRHHRGAERVARRALLAERRALVRLDQALQHLAGAAQWRLVGADVADREAVFGVELGVPVGEFPAAPRDHPDAAPGPVGHLEDVAQHRHRRLVAFGPYGAGVRVVQFVPAGLELR